MAMMALIMVARIPARKPVQMRAILVVQILVVQLLVPQMLVTLLRSTLLLAAERAGWQKERERRERRPEHFLLRK
jgi:hypothetical protein